MKCLLLILLIYLLINIYEGEKLIFLRENLEYDLEFSKNYLQQIEVKVSFIGNKVKLLRGPKICFDLLEEEVKKNLVYLHFQEFIVRLR